MSRPRLNAPAQDMRDDLGRVLDAANMLLERSERPRRDPDRADRRAIEENRRGDAEESGNMLLAVERVALLAHLGELFPELGLVRDRVLGPPRQRHLLEIGLELIRRQMGEDRLAEGGAIGGRRLAEAAV